MRPAAHQVLDTVIATFELYVVPEIDDEYVRSLGLTIGQLLRSVRERMLREPESLWEDNADLRAVLAEMDLPAELAARVEAAIERADRVIGPGVYPSSERLMEQADVLRAALVSVIEATSDAADPARRAGRDYLRRQLERQVPWLVDAWTGPRR